MKSVVYCYKEEKKKEFGLKASFSFFLSFSLFFLKGILKSMVFWMGGKLSFGTKQLCVCQFFRFWWEKETASHQTLLQQKKRKRCAWFHINIVFLVCVVLLHAYFLSNGNYH